MGLKHKATVEKLTWKTAREDVLKVNPVLCQVIDKLSPNDDFILFKGRYPFGAKIMNMGVLQLPTADGTLVPFSSPMIFSDIKDHLKRRSVPVALMLKNLSEVYFEMIDRVICLNIFPPGFIFGLWESLDPPKSYYVKCLWSVVAGARSLYLLPKITEAFSYRELRKKYGVRAQQPRNLVEQWRVFVDIANSQAFPDEWYTEVLFFSDKWMNMATTDTAWKMFHCFMLQQGWDQSQYWRNKVTFDIVRELFINQLIAQNTKPSPYLVDIVKHLVLVGTGVLPAFSAANDDLVGPIEGFQRVLIEDYKLRDYIPTFMRPQVFDVNAVAPHYVYYSMQQPTLLETPLVSRQLQSVLKAMPEIAFLVDTFQSEVNQGKIKAENTPIETFAKRVVIDYFHNEAKETIEGVRPTSEMPKEDKALLHMPKGYNKRIFAETSRFIKGCIRFSAEK